LDFERTGTSPAQADAAYYSFIKASGDGVQNKANPDWLANQLSLGCYVRNREYQFVRPWDMHI